MSNTYSAEDIESRVWPEGARFTLVDTDESRAQYWQNDPCHNVSPTLVAGAEKFHTHVEQNGDVLVCSTTGSRLYRWIQDLGMRRVTGEGDALPGEELAVSDLFPLSFR